MNSCLRFRFAKCVLVASKKVLTAVKALNFEAMAEPFIVLMTVFSAEANITVHRFFVQNFRWHFMNEKTKKRDLSLGDYLTKERLSTA